MPSCRSFEVAGQLEDDGFDIQWKTIGTFLSGVVKDVSRATNRNEILFLDEQLFEDIIGPLHLRSSKVDGCIVGAERDEILPLEPVLVQDLRNEVGDELRVFSRQIPHVEQSDLNTLGGGKES